MKSHMEKESQESVALTIFFLLLEFSLQFR